MGTTRDASGMPPGNAGGGPPAPTAAMKSATEFESVFLSIMLGPIFESLSESATFGGGAAETMWSGMLTETYAAELARNGGVGVADSVTRGLLALQEGGAQ